MILRKGGRRPKDRLVVDRYGHDHTIPSERWWQGSWVCNGYIIDGFADMSMAETLAHMTPEELTEARLEARHWRHA